MSSLIVVGLIVGLPLLLAILFRVSAVMLFLSIAIGSLLASYFGDDFGVVLGSFVHNSNVDIVSNLSLQLLPVALTLILLRKSTPASQFVFHAAPMVLACSALGVLALPLLPPGTEGAFYSSSIGKEIQPASDLIVGAASISVLLLAWFMPKGGGAHRGKKHH